VGDVARRADVVAVLGEPASGEHFGLVGGAVVFEPGEHHPRAHRRGPVPGTVLGREDAVAIVLRKHAAVVERHAEIGGVGVHLDLRIGHVGRRRLVLVFGGAGLAAAEIGEAEIHAGLVGAVELAGRLVVAHAVDLVVGEPERTIPRIEVHAVRYAHAGGAQHAD